MTGFIKKIAFLAPRADLDDSAFRHYWEGTHGPLVGSSPGYSAWRWRYVQNHPLRPGPGGGAFAFSGIAEFWLPPRAPSEEEYVQSLIYRDRIAPDEDHFIDKRQTMSLRAAEQALIPGKGPVKLMRLGRWRGKVTPAHLANLLAALQSEGLASELLDWRVDHVEPGSTRLPGAVAVADLAFDYVETLRFASEDAASAHLGAAAPFRATLLDGPSTALFVRERVFLADGTFTGQGGSPAV